MSSMKKRVLFSTCAALSLGALAHTSPVMAQSGEPTIKEDTIIVSARRREESLQDVPWRFRPSRTDNKFSPRISVEYAASEDFNLYASYAQGFKSGGFNPRGNAAVSSLVATGFGPGANPLFPNDGPALDPNSSTTLDASMIWTSATGKW